MLVGTVAPNTEDLLETHLMLVAGEQLAAGWLVEYAAGQTGD